MLLIGFVAHAAESLLISDIKIKGLQRIEPGLVFSNIPFEINDSIDEVNVSETIKLLYRTGQFRDIAIEQEGSKNTRILEEQLESIGRELTGIASLFKASKSVTRAGFKAYTSSLLEKNDFIKSLQWVPRVPHNLRSSLEKKAQKDGFTDFKFSVLNKKSKIISAPSKNEYFPIYYLQPYSGNESLIGFDISTQPILFKLMKQARDLGKVVAAIEIDLLRKDPKSMTSPCSAVSPR